MRIIKFRGQRIDGEGWVEGLPVDTEKEEAAILRYEEWAENYVRYPVYADTVGQFTGLQDVNGKEIYEGDIVEWRAAGIVGCIVWDDAYCKFMLKDGSECFQFSKLKAYAVLGNMEDNPELINNPLNEKQQ